MCALMQYTLGGVVVDIYLFDCFHKLPSIGTVLMNTILKLNILPDHLLLAEENSDRAICLLLFD